MTKRMTEEEQIQLIARYGSGWCSCMMEKVQAVTPSMLSDYCIYRGFKPYPAPIKEATGTRYAYLIEDNGPKAKLFASFNDFPDFPQATAEGILQSIWRIASFDNTSPDVVAAEILKLAGDMKNEAPPA